MRRRQKKDGLKNIGFEVLCVESVLEGLRSGEVRERRRGIWVRMMLLGSLHRLGFSTEAFFPLASVSEVAVAGQELPLGAREQSCRLHVTDFLLADHTLGCHENLRLVATGGASRTDYANQRIYGEKRRGESREKQEQ